MHCVFYKIASIGSICGLNPPHSYPCDGITRVRRGPVKHEWTSRLALLS